MVSDSVPQKRLRASQKPARRSRASSAAVSRKASQRPSPRLVEDDDFGPEDEAFPAQPVSFVELGGILKDRNPRNRELRRSFMDFILNDVIPGMKARVQAVEDELARQEREIRRAKLKVMDCGRQG